MRLRLFLAAIALPLLASTASAQLEAHLVGFARNSSALRAIGVNCTHLPTLCVSSLPATALAYAGGTAYDATTGGFWVSEGNVLARLEPRNCSIVCGPYAAPVVGAKVTGIEVLERTDELLVLDSSGRLSTLSLSGSCLSPQLLGSCGTGLTHQGQLVTTGIAADEARDLVFMSYVDFATGANSIAVAHRPTACTPFVTLSLPSLSSVTFGAIRGLAVEECRRMLFATDGLRILRVHYDYDPATMSLTFGPATHCTFPSATLDPVVGLTSQPNPGVPVGQSCNSGSCQGCLMRHDLLTGPVLGNPNLVFHLDRAQVGTWTWLALGLGHCSNSGPVIYPLCGPLLIGGASAATPPLVAGPLPVAGGPGLCGGSVSLVVDFPYAPAFCGSEWSSQFISLCVGPVGTAPFGTAMSNCLSWTVVSP